jgi:membrane-associated protein
MDPFILFPLVILGAFLGDILGYTIGHFSSGFVKKKIGNDSNYKMAERFVEKHGGKSVLFARFISGIKEMVPFIAGVLSMKIKRFMI